MTPEKPELPVEMKAAERLVLTPPERHRRVTVADVIGPEATRQAIEEEREFQGGTRRVGPPIRRRTRVDDLLTEDETTELITEVRRSLAIGARARAANFRRR